MSLQTGTNTKRPKTVPLWFNLVDFATVNAFTIFGSQHQSENETNARRKFIRELSKELVMPQIRRRIETSENLKSSVIDAMGRCGLKRQRMVESTEYSMQQGKAKRVRCSDCPNKIDRKASTSCATCKKAICKSHRITFFLCGDCKQ